MRNGGVFTALILLECTIVYTSGDKGKNVLLRIHVPEVIKHQHHTNVVYVHKHHHHYDDHDHHYQHDDHDKDQHKPHAGGNHHAHSYGDHYAYEPPAYHHSHSYGHQQHYSVSDGHGPKLGGPKKKAHGDSKVQKGGEVQHKAVGNKAHQPKHGSEKLHDKEKENVYDFAIKFSYPNSETEHYHYSSYTPTYSFDNNNNLRESNHSIKHESLEIETTRNTETDNFEDFPNTHDGYEVNEPSFHFQTEQHNVNYDQKPNEGNSDYYGNIDKKQNEGSGNYAEDYTNPNSVAKYTSAIQHGAINLQDTNYNPEHGNDLEEYIKASKN